LDKQLEEYMGPDAMKAMLDTELDNYFSAKAAAATNGTAEASTNGTPAEPITVSG